MLIVKMVYLELNPTNTRKGTEQAKDLMTGRILTNEIQIVGLVVDATT